MYTPQDPIIPPFDLWSFYVNVEESFCQNQFYVYIHIIPTNHHRYKTPYTEYLSPSKRMYIVFSELNLRYRYTYVCVFIVEVVCCILHVNYNTRSLCPKHLLAIVFASYMVMQRNYGNFVFEPTNWYCRFCLYP